MLEIGDADHPEASLLGPVTIGSEGKLEGHGTIGGDVANLDGGVLSPGGSIGTLTLGGDYSQRREQPAAIEVSPTRPRSSRSSAIPASPAICSLVYQPGVYADASYDILNAASITGAFGSISGQAPTGFSSVR